MRPGVQFRPGYRSSIMPSLAACVPPCERAGLEVPDCCSRRSAFAPSSAHVPVGQAFTKGLSLQRGIHLAIAWFRHHLAYQEWLGMQDTFTYFNMRGCGFLCCY
jgi:hypothetical protein